MMSRAFRPTAAILSILLLSGVPTHAAPVAISEVIQVLGSYQNPPELRLRSVSQNASSAWYQKEKDRRQSPQPRKNPLPAKSSRLQMHHGRCRNRQHAAVGCGREC